MKHLLILILAAFSACGTPPNDEVTDAVPESDATSPAVPDMPAPAAAPLYNDTLVQPELENPAAPKIPSLAYLTGRFDPTEHPDFVEVAAEYTDLVNSYFAKGEGKKVYDWLTANAATYGFCQPYTPKGDARPNGYEEEKWHWSYLPVATQLTDYAVANLKDTDIAGFAGAEAAPRIGILENYVLGINQACKE